MLKQKSYPSPAKLGTSPGGKYGTSPGGKYSASPGGKYGMSPGGKVGLSPGKFKFSRQPSFEESIGPTPSAVQKYFAPIIEEEDTPSHYVDSFGSPTPGSGSQRETKEQPVFKL